jgi:hypothetical protein
MSLLRTVAVTGTVVALAAGGVGVAVLSAGPASAGTTTAALSSSSVALSAGLADADKDAAFDTICVRVPVALARVQKVQTRFAADVNTKGSIAYLEARIAKAQSEGKTDVVRLLDDRLVMRKDLAGILANRLEQLQDAQQVCAAHGHSGSPASAPASSPA